MKFLCVVELKFGHVVEQPVDTLIQGAQYVEDLKEKGVEVVKSSIVPQEPVDVTNLH